MADYRELRNILKLLPADTHESLITSSRLPVSLMWYADANKILWRTKYYCCDIVTRDMDHMEQLGQYMIIRGIRITNSKMSMILPIDDRFDTIDQLNQYTATYHSNHSILASFPSVTISI